VAEDAVAFVGHLVTQVDVGVRGELVVRMAEDLLDDDETGAGLDQHAGACVPEIVELDPAELQCVLNYSERPSKVVGAHRGPDLAREHQIAPKP
jgi:hypothetical protein